MHHLALSPASSYLLILHYFSHFIVDFSYIFAGQTSEIQAQQNSVSFMLCSPALTLQSFFLFVAFLWFASLFLFQLYTAGDKTRHNGQEAPTVSIMSFCVVALEPVWPCLVVPACRVSSPVMLSPVSNVSCGQVHGILQTSTVCVFNNFP